jgi:hypothetical protein
MYNDRYTSSISDRAGFFVIEAAHAAARRSL